ncbi:hypothetical protein FH609_006515 [Streptomyces sp. 3MP-14]|uniref:Uncharacterized protein n=1 Tax=Streptomyces mimosae TaxID=2586635 RepID=A0A5N6AMQ5_9ACTN|nr:hypothetical protein FH607_004195 [Streptomyces mimosae]KAB8178662.1 hypothetical protein FH609_006515 [Streptomyces sp. 3MP-14]
MPCSPRTRGWSVAGGGRPPARQLLPAHAGMVPAGARLGRDPGPVTVVLVARLIPGAPSFQLPVRK